MMCEADSSPTCLRPLLAQLIDYAGLFPPAALTLEATVRNYAAYRSGEYAWLLGRLIVPSARLNEFEQTAEPFCDGTSVWSLSILSCGAPLADLATIHAFNQRWQGRALIDALEWKPGELTMLASTLAELANELPNESLPHGLAVYVELPLPREAAADDLPTALATLATHEARAKVRTGGVTPEAFPTSRQLARFLHACAAADVPFKATAGLHHPLRAEHPLTYDAESARGTMHGFLNVFLAAAFAQDGATLDELTALLEERDLAAFRFERDAVFWRERMLVKPHVTIARHLFALSFGSCSFTEPIADLQALGLL